MNTKNRVHKDSAEKAVRDIRRATRRHYSAEEKIRIVLEGLRGYSPPTHILSLSSLPSKLIGHQHRG